jgi:hypothetical protein
VQSGHNPVIKAVLTNCPVSRPLNYPTHLILAGSELDSRACGTVDGQIRRAMALND